MSNYLDLSTDKQRVYVHRTLTGIQIRMPKGQFTKITNLNHGDLTAIMSWLSTTPTGVTPAKARFTQNIHAK